MWITDWRNKRCKGKDKYLPHLLGHEATGKIIKVSDNTKNLKKNDKVILHWQKIQEKFKNTNLF